MTDQGPRGQSPSQGGGSDEERARLLDAFARAASEHGYAELTLEQVLGYAELSRAEFEAHFENKEQGLIAAQDAFLDKLWLDVVGSCDAPREWPLRVRAAVEAALASLVEASSQARVFAIEAAATSIAAAERQQAALDRFAALLREGRELYPTAAALPEATERTLIGGVSSIVSTHLLREDPQAIPEQERELVELLLMPYVGVAEAKRLATI